MLSLPALFVSVRIVGINNIYCSLSHSFDKNRICLLPRDVWWVGRNMFWKCTCLLNFIFNLGTLILFHHKLIEIVVVCWVLFRGVADCFLPRKALRRYLFLFDLVRKPSTYCPVMLLESSRVQRRPFFSYFIWHGLRNRQGPESYPPIGWTTFYLAYYILYVIYRRPFDKAFAGWAPWDRIPKLRLWSNRTLTEIVHCCWGCDYSHI